MLQIIPILHRTRVCDPTKAFDVEYVSVDILKIGTPESAPAQGRNVKTQEDVADLMAKVFNECYETRASGQKEYAHDEGNALRNFEGLAADLGIGREEVLWVYMKKHLDGILAYIRGHRSQREDVRGRIKDVIVYLILFQAMVEDDEGGEAT